MEEEISRSFSKVKLNTLKFRAFDSSVQAKAAFRDDLKNKVIHHKNQVPYINFKFSGFDVEKLKFEKNIEDLPFMHVDLFKSAHFQSCTNEEIALTLTSSGTGGQKSQMILDADSLSNVKAVAYQVYDELGVVDDKIYNYLCFTYDPAIANDLGTAFTDELLTSFTQKAEVFYTFQHNGSEFIFEKEKTIAKLKEFASSNHPTRILGFPAFLYELIREFDINLDLGKSSWLLTGGGWKGQQEKEIPKQEFKNLILEKLGIPVENIRDLFGMVEHGIPYVECAQGKFRISNHARVIVRDHKTLKALPYGEVGILQFICAYNSSYPSFSYLSTDKGMLLESSDEFGDELVLLGRAGVTKHKGCAIKALELLN